MENRVTGSTVQSQQSSPPTQPSNSTSKGTRDPHAYRDMPLSQSARSASRGSSALSQASIATSTGLPSIREDLFGRANAASQHHSANFAGSQSVSSATPLSDPTDRSAGRDAARPVSRRTYPSTVSAGTQPTYQILQRRAGAQIAQPTTQRTEAAAQASSPGGGAPRGELMNRRTDVTVAPTGPAVERSQIELSDMTPRHHVTATEVRTTRSGRAVATGLASDYWSRFHISEHPSEPSPIINEYESRPPNIRFHIFFSDARVALDETYEGETLYGFVSKVIAHHNATVPRHHPRMKPFLSSNSNIWALSGHSMDQPSYHGKSIPFPIP